MKRWKKLVTVRPTASLTISIVALFVALSSGAYAAMIIPAHSVGATQLKHGAVQAGDLAGGAVRTPALANGAVTYNKIAPGQIGQKRVDQNQIQRRVTGKCLGAEAVQSISNTGSTLCAPTRSIDYSTPGLSESLVPGAKPTIVASESIGANGLPLYVTADPYVEVQGSSGAQNVVVTCGVTGVIGGSQGGPIYTYFTGPGAETRKVSFVLNSASEQAVATIPLSETLPGVASGGSADTDLTYDLGVSCSTANDGTVAPKVQVTSGLDAFELGSITSQVTPGTSSGSLTLTTPTQSTTTPAG